MLKHASPSYSVYKGYGQKDPVREIAEAMMGSDPLPTPNSPRDRAIGESLMASGMDYSPVGHWTQGLARMGQALAGRRMVNQADKDQADYQKAASDQATQDIIAMLGPNADPRAIAAAKMNPEMATQAIISELMPSRADMLAERRFEHSSQMDKQNLFNSEDQRNKDNLFRENEAERDQANTDRVFDYRVARDGVTDDQWSAEYDLAVAGHNLNVDKVAAASTKQPQTNMSPALEGLSPGIQSAIVRNEQDALDKAAEAAAAARKAAEIGRRFMEDSKGYHALGGGFLADAGQIFSNRTARLKTHTNQLIPLQRTAGEGPMTDKDAERYAQSVVNINQPRAANQAVSNVYNAVEQNAIEYERFLRNFQTQNGYGSIRQAELLWDEYSNAVPIFDPETGKPVEDRMPIGMWLNGEQDQQNIPEVQTAEQQAALPVGTQYRAPDGSIRVKR
ncbi:MAG: hypothetical protein AAFP81_19390 [Pseudomonadota bacterium]